MGQYDQSVGIKQNALWVTIFKSFCGEAFSFAGFEANEPFKLKEICKRVSVSSRLPLLLLHVFYV